MRDAKKEARDKRGEVDEIYTILTVSYETIPVWVVYKGVMKALLTFTLASMAIMSVDARGPRPSEIGASKQAIGSPGVVWYTTWDTALAEAKRSKRPIFFMAAAAQCNGISGVF